VDAVLVLTSFYKEKMLGFVPRPQQKWATKPKLRITADKMIISVFVETSLDSNDADGSAQRTIKRCHLWTQ